MKPTVYTALHGHRSRLKRYRPKDPATETPPPVYSRAKRNRYRLEAERTPSETLFLPCIDFGTTNSSMVVMVKDDGDESIDTIEFSLTAGSSDTKSEQIPSVSLYAKSLDQDGNSVVDVLHGHEAERYLSPHEGRGNLEKICFVRNMKHILGDDSHAGPDECEDEELRLALNELKRLGLIEKDEDVIVEFLAYVFKRTKESLETNHGLNDNSKSKSS